MAKRISKSSSARGKKIWEGVSKAAKNSPEWAKPKVKEAARASAGRIVSRIHAQDGLLRPKQGRGTQVTPETPLPH